MLSIVQPFTTVSIFILVLLQNCETALHFASKFGNPEVVKLLVDHRMCDKTLKNKYGETAREVSDARIPYVTWSMSHLSKIQILIFLHHLLITSKCFNLTQTPLQLDIWLQSYEEYVNAKNNIKQLEHCFCHYLKTNITDIRLIPLDHVTYTTHKKIHAMIWFIIERTWVEILLRLCVWFVARNCIVTRQASRYNRSAPSMSRLINGVCVCCCMHVRSIINRIIV